MIMVKVIFYTSFCYHDIARAGAFHWRTLTPNIVTSWERRAAYLNTRPVPGLLSTFPHTELVGDLETMVITAIHVDWKLLCTAIHSSIKREPQVDKNINNVVGFGFEQVEL